MLKLSKCGDKKLYSYSPIRTHETDRRTNKGVVGFLLVVKCIYQEPAISRAWGKPKIDYILFWQGKLNCVHLPFHFVPFSSYDLDKWNSA